MTGFTLGDTTGATLGDESGGTLGAAVDAWALDGSLLVNPIEEVATHRTLTLTFRVRTSTLVEHARALKPNEDAVNVHPTDDGGFRAVDRANGGNTFTLDPPVRRQDLRQPGTYHVRRYEEDLVSADVDEWDVEVEFVPAANREDTPGITTEEQVPASTADSGGTLGESSGFTLGNTAGATLGVHNGRPRPRDWWQLDVQHGPIVTDRVDAEFLGTGADGVERFELVMRLSYQQALVFEASLARVGGVRVRSLPDASNRAVDETSDSANTVRVASPTQDVVETGDYVVTEWESRRLNDAFQEVAAVLAREG